MHQQVESEFVQAGTEPEEKFTLLQLRWIDAYMDDPERSVKRASEKVGVNPISAQRWLDLPHIAREIAYREGKRLKGGVNVIDRTTQWVTQITRRCMQKVAVKAPDGRVVGYKFDAANALKGCELIYKVFGVLGGSSKVEDAKEEERQRLTIADVLPLVRASQRIIADERSGQQIIVNSTPDDRGGLTVHEDEVESHRNQTVKVPEMPEELREVRSIADFVRVTNGVKT